MILSDIKVLLTIANIHIGSNPTKVNMFSFERTGEFEYKTKSGYTVSYEYEVMAYKRTILKAYYKD